MHRLEGRRLLSDGVRDGVLVVNGTDRDDVITITVMSKQLGLSPWP